MIRNNNNKNSKSTLTELEQMAKSGRSTDIDTLMKNLETGGAFLQYKMIDYALGLVSSSEGRARIKHFLFNGNKMQRNYAALYFKRIGANIILEEAVRNGCIDEVQAYSR